MSNLVTKIRSSGRVAERDGLENRCAYGHRGFESLLLRSLSAIISEGEGR